MITIYLDSKSKKPYYEQIYAHLREEIRKGHLKTDEKLPSGRKLATHLGVSRSTVENAYAQLLAEGYVYSSAKRGYFVAQIGELLNLIPITAPTVPAQAKAKPSMKWDFSPFGGDVLNFPDSYWRKLSKECINYDDGTLFRSSEPQGDSGLREELVNYLRQNRGVNCRKESIIIGAGSQYLMMLLLQLIKNHSVIAMENPSYMQSYETFRSMKCEVVPVPVDEQGIVVDELKKTEANITYVTPSHQYPTGVILSANRRTQLLNWANYEPSRYIIEDDYDSEFRYQGKPIPALQSVDKGKKVVYMGSFSKVVSPAIRMSYMVLPDTLLAKYQEVFCSFPCTVSRLDQAIMTKFLKDGYFERHLNRLRNRYKARHDCLMKELKRFGDLVHLSGTNAGSHVVVEWLGEMSEAELILRAYEAGIQLYPLKDSAIAPCFRMYPTFLFGFAQLSEEDICEAIKELCNVWKG